MKSELSAIELHYLIEEMKPVSNSKVDKIYQPKKEEILFQLHKTGVGKRIIRISGKFMHLTEHKSESPQTPFGFCTYLRKKLSNSVLKEVRQIGSERIAELFFETKEKKMKIVVELFGTGNIILVDDKNIIMSPMITQQFKEREIASGKEYSYPKREHNLFEIKEDQFRRMLKDSHQEYLVKALASDLGIGGIYSEEICIISKIEKSRAPGSLSEKEAGKVFAALKDVLSRAPEPQVVKKGEEIIDIVPFALEIYKKAKEEGKDIEIQKIETYNKAFDAILTEHTVVKEKAETEKVRSKELERIKNSIAVQEKNVIKQHKDAEENQKKGEAIYENYLMIKDILDSITTARKKYSFSEIKEKLKGHKTVKEINEKEGKVIIEI
jgi:predicted ribosome quality control (RQC) complex YloA/Tae2 family protein